MNKALRIFWLAILLCFDPVLAMADPQEDFEVGLELYDAGNHREALKWFGSAAEQGLAQAQLKLGAMFFNGLGVDKDYGQALFWFTKAAERGDPEAQTNLGYMYDKAFGVQQDFKQAIAWYRKAAEQGYANAQFDLGMMYYEGLGVIQDYVEAHKWLNIAASNGHPEAASSREHGEKRMTNAQIAEAQKRASEWQGEFEKHQCKDDGCGPRADFKPIR